ncbi:hypothetical protein HXX76_002504 [Chlamydomonas incerta]|uniref:Uncharacterized protein n=1 Tax=Chlamydomonas incerta TaxID=51695 RepID=A0A835TC53_CHLIN|nr:hypothetical protein HXX76_002504 [Chlamydomonas incerta]|eukprot:KAG2442418.1 hypothetical protein HXX76_002504 [Chlamydomonas incerta]
MLASLRSSRIGFTATRPAFARRGVAFRPRAAGEDLPPATRITAEDACKLLDVGPNASFEEILQQKNRKLAQADGDVDKVVEIEAAYDILFMRSMKKRITGELEVSTAVRYADVPTQRKAAPKASPQALGGMGGLASKVSAPKLPAGGLPVGFAVPNNQQVVLTQAGVFGGVALWALAQAVLESPDAQLADTAGLQLSLALGYAVYSLRENKKMGLGKAVALVFGCLFAGAMLGTGLESWLRVDIVPIGSFGSPGVFVSEVVILLVALGAIFLV